MPTVTKYQDTLADAATGRPVANATITVTNYPANTPATLYSSDGSTVSTAPIITDVNGFYYFFAVPGQYNITVNLGALTLALTDVLVGPFVPGGGLAPVEAAAAGAIVQVRGNSYLGVPNATTQAAINAYLLAGWPATSIWWWCTGADLAPVTISGAISINSMFSISEITTPQSVLGVVVSVVQTSASVAGPSFNADAGISGPASVSAVVLMANSASIAFPTLTAEGMISGPSSVTAVVVVPVSGSVSAPAMDAIATLLGPSANTAAAGAVSVTIVTPTLNATATISSVTVAGLTDSSTSLPAFNAIATISGPTSVVGVISALSVNQPVGSLKASSTLSTATPAGTSLVSQSIGTLTSVAAISGPASVSAVVVVSSSAAITVPSFHVNSTLSAPVEVGTVISSAPSAPTLTLTTTAAGSITVGWGAVTNATSYNLYWKAGSTGPTAENGSDGATKVPSVTSPYTLSGLTAGSTYSLKVSAVGSGGESALSNVVTAAAAAAAQIYVNAYSTGLVTVNGTVVPPNSYVSLAGKTSFTATIKAPGGPGNFNDGSGDGGAGGKIVATFNSLVGTYYANPGLTGAYSAGGEANVASVSNDPVLGGSGGSSTAAAGGGGGSDSDDGGQGSSGDSCPTLSGSGGTNGVANGVNGYDDGYGGGVGGTGGYANVSSVTVTDGGGMGSSINGTIAIVTTP